MIEMSTGYGARERKGEAAHTAFRPAPVQTQLSNERDESVATPAMEAESKPAEAAADDTVLENEGDNAKAERFGGVMVRGRGARGIQARRHSVATILDQWPVKRNPIRDIFSRTCSVVSLSCCPC